MVQLRQLLALVLVAATMQLSRGQLSTCSSDSQCLNGGTCQAYQAVSGEVFSACACANGWTGRECTVPPTCAAAQVTCYNGGDCPVAGSRVCQNCPNNADGLTGFRGQFCQLAVNLCPLRAGIPAQFQSWCANNGTCASPSGNTYVCRCPPLFGGQQCERRTFAPAPPPAATGLDRKVEVPAWVAAPIVAGIVILMGTCGFLFFVIHRERKGTPVFTRLEAEGTRRQGLQEFASSEESKGGDAGRISDPPRYAASSPRTPNNNV